MMGKSLLMATSAATLTLTLGVLTHRPIYASSPAGTVHRVTKTVRATTVNGTFAFSPAKLTIHLGTKVVWTNPSPAPHTVTGKGHWSVNKQLPQGQSVSVIFSKTGTYHYYCAIHPYMLGTIIVRK